MRARSALLLIAGLLGAALIAFIYRPLFWGELLVGRDAFRLFIPARVFIEESLSRGELPLWNPYLRLGQPFAASLIVQGLYLPTWLTTVVFGPALGFTVQHLLHVALAGVGGYLAARALRASPLAALVTALTFGASPLLTDLNGHRNVVDAAAWAGWMVWAAARLARGGQLRWGVALAVFTSASFYAGSPETLVWELLFVLATFWAQRPSLPSWGRAGVAGVACLGLSAALLLPALEFLRLTTRGAGSPDSVDWSASWAQLLALGWPRADQPRGEYWGDDQWWMVTVFVGAVPSLLALASLRRSRRVLAIAGVTLLLAALALGKHLPLTSWLWTSGPLGAFRFPAKFLVGVAFGVALLAGLAVQRLSVVRRRSAWGLALAVGVPVVMVLLGPTLLKLLGARPGVMQGLPWVAGAVLLTLLAVFSWPVGSERRARVAGALLTVAALELVAHHALNKGFGWEKPERLMGASSLADAIPDDFRGRISLAMTDALVGPRDPSLPSFIDTSRDALVPNRHQEERLRALEGYGAPEPRWLDEFQLAGDRAIFDLTGVEYYVRNGRPPYPDLQTVKTGPGLPTLYRSATALPRARLLHRVEVLSSEEAVLERLRAEGQPARSALLLADGEFLNRDCEGSTVKFTADEPHRLVLEVDSCGEGYLLLADAHFPGWVAEVDGREEEILRADYALRAVRVDAGRHQVLLRYSPTSFTIGGAITLLTIAVLILAALALRRRGPS